MKKILAVKLVKKLPEGKIGTKLAIIKSFAKIIKEFLFESFFLKITKIKLDIIKK